MGGNLQNYGAGAAGSNQSGAEDLPCSVQRMQTGCHALCQSAFLAVRGQDLPHATLIAFSCIPAITKKRATRGNFLVQFTKTPRVQMRQNLLF